jgi:hypothetical protein
MDNKPGKRQSKMNNIRSRMNSGSYNMAKFDKNEKNLKEKIAFFEKKDEAGQLKGYMYPRMEEAKALYERLLALKSNAPLPAATAFEAEQGEGQRFANSQRNAATEALFQSTLSSIPAATRTTAAIPKMTLKKLNKKRQAASYVLPEFNPPPPSPPALPLPYGQYNRNGTFHVAGTVQPTTYNLGGNAGGGGGGGGGSNEFYNLQNPAGNAATAAAAAVAATAAAETAAINRTIATRRKRTPVPVYNEYYEQVVPEFLPLPEMYDPYTGRKFAPEEDPLPPIESAYHELKDILKRAHLKAASLRRKAARATKRKTKAKKNNTRFNQGLRIRIPPNNTLSPTGQQLQSEENLHI